MTDDFEDALRETLGQAVPNPPDAPDRAAGARSYSRRARRTKAGMAVGVVAVVATMAVVVPSVLAGPNSGDPVADPGPKSPTAKPTLSMPVPDPIGCSVTGHFLGGATLPEPAVRAGAVLARMCQSPTSPVSWTVPAEPLVTDVDGLVAAVNRLPKTSPKPCPQPQAPAFTLRLHYPGNRIVDIDGQLSGCDLVSYGSTLRVGARSLLLDFLGRLDDQRESYAPPAVSSAPNMPCNQSIRLSQSAVVVDGRSLALRTAQLCVVSSYVGGQQVEGGLLTPAEIGVLNADFARHRSRARPDDSRVDACLSVRGGGIPTYEITGASAWGDQVRLTGACGLFSYTDRSGHWYWVPSPAVATMLDQVAHPLGRVTGQLMAVGGPAPGAPGPLPGRITVRTHGRAWQIVTRRDGRFAIEVPPGDYRIVGQSWGYGSGKYECQPAHPVTRVRGGQVTRVDVFCQER